MSWRETDPFLGFIYIYIWFKWKNQINVNWSALKNSDLHLISLDSQAALKDDLNTLGEDYNYI